MRPIQTVLTSTSSRYWLSSLPQRRVGTITESRMISPPIVGVPSLTRWVPGPSLLSCCPICLFLRNLMMTGPMKNAISRAVTVA